MRAQESGGCAFLFLPPVAPSPRSTTTTTTTPKEQISGLPPPSSLAANNQRTKSNANPKSTRQMPSLLAVRWTRMRKRWPKTIAARRAVRAEHMYSRTSGGGFKDEAGRCRRTRTRSRDREKRPRLVVRSVQIWRAVRNEMPRLAGWSKQRATENAGAPVFSGLCMHVDALGGSWERVG